MKKIVSANYLDRSSPFRWLVRDKGAEPETAKPFKSVEATGVRFVASSAYEAGFGCRIIAECKTAEGSNYKKDGMPAPKATDVELRFDGHDFVGPQDTWVSKCASLSLRADGSMFATL